jgi:hypothetical protein
MTESPVRNRVACVTTAVLTVPAGGVAAMAADPAARPKATTKAFNLGLLGIIELLLMGRSTDTRVWAASVRRKSAMRTPHPAAKPPSPA